jgi:hypothetical protein
MNVTRTIDGDTIIISPMFNGGCEPTYWEVSINNRVIWRTFASAKEAHQYVESMYRRGSKGVRSAGVFAPFLTDV